MPGLGLVTILKNVIVTLGRQLGAGILQLVTLAIIARVFGPSGNGAYTLTLLLPTLLATFLNLGMSPANVYFLGAKKVNAQYAWNVTLKISVWLVFLGWGIGAYLLSFHHQTLFPDIPSTLLILSLGCFPLVLLTANISSFFQGLQQFKQFNIVLLLQPVLNLITISMLIILGIEDLLYIMMSYFGSLFITLCVAYRLLKKLLSSTQYPKPPNYGKQLLNYGYKAHFSNILAFVNYRADLFILGYFLGPLPVGIYVIAVNITEKLWLLSTAISTVLLPKLSELSDEEDKRKVLTPLISRWVLWLTLMASALLALVGEWLIRFIFGTEFDAAYTAILYLLPGIVFGASSKVLANDIAARGRPELNLATSWISVTINVLGNIILIPKMGLLGAALATSISYSVNFVLRLVMHQYFTQVPFYKNLFIGKADWFLLWSFFHNKSQ